MDTNVLDQILSATHRTSLWRFIQALFYISIIVLAIFIIWLLVAKVIPTLTKVLPLINDILKAENCDPYNSPNSNTGKIVSDIICYDENIKHGRQPYTTVGDTYQTILNISEGVNKLVKRFPPTP